MRLIAFYARKMTTNSTCNPIKLSPKQILFKNEHYLVIDKPHDIRMDGCFDLTVEKLLTSTFPGTSHSNFKWVHQLDFATSGLLCVALTKEAAAIASTAFEKRETRKEYLALLEGHVDITQFRSKSSHYLENLRQRYWPIDSKCKPEVKADQENRVENWQHQLLNANLDLSLYHLEQYLTSNNEYDEALAGRDAQWRELSELSKHKRCLFESNSKLRKQLRKALKTAGLNIEYIESTNLSVAPSSSSSSSSSSIFQKSTNNESGKHKLQGSKDKCLPIVSRIWENLKTHKNRLNEEFLFRQQLNSCETCDANIDSANLVISVPLLEPTNDFRMDIGVTDTDVSPHAKYSETHLRVLSRTYLQGRPVTKVKLILMTGRRHQLRVHCLCLGHPIVGDITYCTRCDEPLLLSSRLTTEYSNQRENLDRKGEEEIMACSSLMVKNDVDVGMNVRRRSDTERMMLHAYKFTLPLPSTYKPRPNTSEYFREIYTNSNIRFSHRNMIEDDLTSDNVMQLNSLYNEPIVSTEILEAQSKCANLKQYLIDIQSEDPFRFCESAV